MLEPDRQRDDVVGLVISRVVDELQARVEAVLAQIIFDFLGAVSGHDGYVVDLDLSKPVDDASEDRRGSDRQQRLVGAVREWSHAASISRRQDERLHQRLAPYVAGLARRYGERARPPAAVAGRLIVLP